MFDGAKVVIIIGKDPYIIRITIFVLEIPIFLGGARFFIYLHFLKGGGLSLGFLDDVHRDVDTIFYVVNVNRSIHVFAHKLCGIIVT